MKKLLGLLLCGLVLTGCSGAKETTTVCQGDLGKVNNISVSQTADIEAEGDTVKKMTTVATYDFTDVLSDYYTMEDAESMIKENVNYDSLKGVTTKFETKDNTVILTVTVDYDKADMSALESAGLITSENGKTPDFVSLEKTVDGFKDEGATCKEK